MLVYSWGDASTQALLFGAGPQYNLEAQTLIAQLDGLQAMSRSNTLIKQYQRFERLEIAGMGTIQTLSSLSLP